MSRKQIRRVRPVRRVVTGVAVFAGAVALGRVSGAVQEINR